MVKILTVDKVTLVEVECHEVGIRQSGVTLEKEEVASLAEVSRGNGEVADGIELLHGEAVDILLVAPAYLEAKAAIRIFLHEVVNDGIVNEEFQILVIVVDGGLSYLASMQYSSIARTLATVRSVKEFILPHERKKRVKTR